MVSDDQVHYSDMSEQGIDELNTFIKISKDPRLESIVEAERTYIQKHLI